MSEHIRKKVFRCLDQNIWPLSQQATTLNITTPLWPSVDRFTNFLPYDRFGCFIITASDVKSFLLKYNFNEFRQNKAKQESRRSRCNLEPTTTTPTPTPTPTFVNGLTAIASTSGRFLHFFFKNFLLLCPSKCCRNGISKLVLDMWMLLQRDIERF